MKRHLILPCMTLLFIACKDNQSTTQNNRSKDTAIVATTPLPAANNTAAADADSVANETSTYYVVMADTGNSYYQLHDDMMQLNTATGIQIDTQGRGYNAEKNLICLPENDEDEVYAGEYYPRRFPSVNLSLEYLDVYMHGEKAGENTMALVAGIFETQQSADSLLRVIKPHSKKAFVAKAEVYTGCMH